MLDAFGERYHAAWLELMRTKLGLPDAQPQDERLIADLLAAMAGAQADYTTTWRLLADHLRGGTDNVPGVQPDWLARWEARLAGEPSATAAAMDAVNPAYVPRNHLVEGALTAALAGDLGPFERLLAAISDPYAARPGLADLAEPAPSGFTERHVTYCGT